MFPRPKSQELLLVEDPKARHRRRKRQIRLAKSIGSGSAAPLQAVVLSAQRCRRLRINRDALIPGQGGGCRTPAAARRLPFRLNSSSGRS